MTGLAELRGVAPLDDGSAMNGFRTSTETELEQSDEPAEAVARPRSDERYAPLLREFQAAIDERVERERRLAEELAEEQDQRERELGAELDAGLAAHQAELARIDGEYEERRSAVVSAAESIESEARAEHLARVREIESHFYRESADVESRHQDSTWVTSSVLDDNAEDSPLRQFERASLSRERTRDQQVLELDALGAALQAAIAERGWRGRAVDAAEVQPRSLDEAQQSFTEQIAEARGALEAVAALRLPRLFLGYGWMVAWLLLAGAVFASVYLLVPPALVGIDAGMWGSASGGIAVVVSVLLVLVMYTLGAMRQSELFQQAQHAEGTARQLHTAWRELAARAHQKQQAEFTGRQAEFATKRQQSLDRYERALKERREELERTRAADLQAENARFGELQLALQSAHAEQVAAIEEEHASVRQSIVTAAGSAQQSLKSALDEHVQRRRRRQAELWHELKTEWDAATRQLEASVQQAQAESGAAFAPWSELASGGWSPATGLPTGIRRGEYRIDLERWPQAIPDDMRLAPRATQVVVPSVSDFPSAASLFVRTLTAESRAASARLLQSVVLRWLTLMPPGKLRLTILDPVGLGENFAGFMHLADYDELLVTKRIWTEPDQIEQQLGDLTQHMENVLQKYLRNEFATIEEYNTFAGEVAEPYRLLVVTDFPAKFSELAARRLTSIISSGPRCGVFTLLSMDPKRDLPHGFDASILEDQLPSLNWRRVEPRASALSDLLTPDSEAAPAPAPAEYEPGFRVNAAPLSQWPLAVDPPPSPEQFTSIVRSVGEASKDARRVEVSFDRIAPPADQLWTLSSRGGIDIPLGRAGATKHQHLRLGKGTSQHMLVAGKTGSGKSTFLHCLVTNLALHYSPDEVRFSLVDFKKGVEFKAYAAFQLPHADVIAIESDREFGVSVLQRLDVVLQERGDRFRRAGVQDLAGYRAARPDEPLPRLLLVIDEFQEFFVEEDRLSQTAALLLDRLIRQGRAFGMHVVLGSQTLGGAYSLARSTMGQVAVRVALQCSEADAHLILSEENTAARLLTRPGEAIYNDANGLVEGNHPFQIAWLPDDQRETWLRRVEALAAEQERHDPPAIVFEGNIPSDPARNAPLVQLLQARASGAAVAGEFAATPQAWLGETVEIKPPTALMFERRNGANVLLVGQDSDAALGILTTAALTLAAQVAPGPLNGAAPVTVLDGSQPDSLDAAAWQLLARRFPESIQVLGTRGTGDAIDRLAAELQRRTAEPDVVHPPRFLVVHHLSRFRDLRKSDDEFGFSSFGGGSGEEKPVDPSKQFADLLANGPVVGIHVLIWCDSANTVERWISRTTMRELENRIVFQMNSSDSSNLVDSPAAAKLGPHRALLYREETGTSEKFRPYHAPEAAWLQSLARVETPPAAAAGNEADMAVARELSEFRIL